MLRNPTGLCLKRHVWKKQTRFHLTDKAPNLRGIKERERETGGAMKDRYRDRDSTGKTKSRHS